MSKVQATRYEQLQALAGDRNIKHYFVDEAGDLTLFDKRKRIIVGKEGVSWCFMVGLLDLPAPAYAHRELEALRAELLADPYFRGVPSMQPEAKKTAVVFHAKDDLPEVRREVLKLVPSLGGKMIVAIRRKKPLAEQHKLIHKATGAKFKEDEAYDELVSRVFDGKLHKADENRILFAHRGKSSRENALEDALIKARRAFEHRWGKRSDKPTTIDSAYPSQSAGLQVADYFLWALQRMYEVKEDRFFELLAPHYRLIMDLDDTRNKPYGEYYSDSNRLELWRIQPVAS